MTRVCTCTPRTGDEGIVEHAPVCALFGEHTLTDPNPDPALVVTDEPAAANSSADIPAHVGYDLVAPTAASILHCAVLVHGAIKALNDAFNEYTVPWESGSKESAIAGIEFLLENPKATPEDQHNEWMRAKLADGWMYGLTKSVEFKTHPLLVSYDKLGPHARAKDAIFQEIVKAYFGV